MFLEYNSDGLDRAGWGVGGGLQIEMELKASGASGPKLEELQAALNVC